MLDDGRLFVGYLDLCVIRSECLLVSLTIISNAKLVNLVI